MKRKHLSLFADTIYSVVLVHGLNGDRIKTWSKDNVCWPRDLLKEDLPNARILSVCVDRASEIEVINLRSGAMMRVS
jgi:hypothetical protein